MSSQESNERAEKQISQQESVAQQTTHGTQQVKQSKVNEAKKRRDRKKRQLDYVNGLVARQSSALLDLSEKLDNEKERRTEAVKRLIQANHLIRDLRRDCQKLTDSKVESWLHRADPN